jgi:phytoene dehydrogenase-like protein
MTDHAFDYDVITVGGGHNALITSAYLAQAGYKVGVFERRDIIGGAVSTKEIVPGYQFDLGGSAHILIRLTPIVQELQLEKYGLEYIELDPLFFAPFPDGDSVFFYRDANKTINHLEEKFPGQGEAYARFLNDWRPLMENIKEFFQSSPSPLDLGKKMIMGKASQMSWTYMFQSLLRPYGDVVDDYFTEDKIKTPLTWMAAQSGPPPTEARSGPFVLWQPLYHEGGAARPKGGSGMLTQALAKHIQAHGGEVHLNAPVEKILVEGNQAVGIQVAGQIYTARAVVAGTHALETFGKLLPPEHRPRGAKNLRTGNGFGAILRLALNAPISYTAYPGKDARVALQLLCRDRQQINTAFNEYQQGHPSQDPPIFAMSFSAVDDTLAPPGGEVLWLWAQYFPYELAEGNWDDRAEAVANRILDNFEQYAPGTRDKIVGQLFQHPLWLERELGLYRGNVMHLEMSMDQMFILRPFLGMAHYKTHLKGLYLTGASTHPGGGIMGASGRNAARVVLKDLA